MSVMIFFFYKVSYRKQTARQHSCYKKFGIDRGRGRSVKPVKIFLSSSLIAMQNLVAVSHTVCAHVGGGGLTHSQYTQTL